MVSGKNDKKENGSSQREHGSLEWMFNNASNWSVKNMADNCFSGTIFPKFCQFMHHCHERDEVFGSDWQKSMCYGIDKSLHEGVGKTWA